MEKTNKIVEKVSKAYEIFRSSQMRKPKKRFRCPCCNLNAFNEKELQKHYKTEKHRRNQQRGMVKH